MENIKASTMIDSIERPTLATFSNALERGASAPVTVEGAAAVMLATGGSGGSTTSETWRGGRGVSAGGCASRGTKESREPACAGRMLYSGLSVFVHGLSAVPKKEQCVKHFIV
ncbi:hypothetical protein F2P56_034767 [Juglans regia]|uniref:Uncharacterized protein n=1 Tax=Juglans regia TaxID=51240 RepID=A0A833U7T1_JUGRE|nr:hypothetical protein F2P56_034767 [Juglans regia]